MVEPYARLITPEGKSIELSPDLYRKIRLLLHGAGQPSPEERNQLLGNLYGKYAGGESLTAALLAERKAELLREESRLDKYDE